MSIRLRPEDSRISGIIGNAIPIPNEPEPVPIVARTPKPKAATATRPKPIKNSATIATPVECTCGLREKLIKCQSSEKEARAKIELLSRTIDDLKKEIGKSLENGDRALKETEAKWKAQFDALDSRLKAETQAKEDATRLHAKCDLRISELKDELEKLRTRYLEDLESLRKKFETELSAVQRDRDEQVRLREEKITKLKTQIADKLAGNSSERQKQIDDLLKEMNRLQEEHEVLKAKLRTYSQAKNVQPVCDNCTTSNARVKVLEDRLKEREALVTELRGMCDKFDRQLRQNDQLLTISTEFEKSRVKRK